MHSAKRFPLRYRSWARASLAGTVLIGVASCGGARLPPKELTDAREELVRARGVAAVSDPTDLHEADVALAAAERAWQDDPDSPSALDLAIAAQRRAQIAEAEAQVAAAVRQAQAARQQTQALAASRLSATQGRLGQTERQLDQTREQLRHEQQESAEQRQRLMDAEAKLTDARNTIAKIAMVKDDERGMVITLPGELFFPTGKSDVKPGGMAKLDIIAQALKGKEQVIRVIGYTDDVGARENNVELSQRRARTVRDYLVGKGFPSDRVLAEGRGPDNPVSDNTSLEGRAANRRVELIVEPKTR